MVCPCKFITHNKCPTVIGMATMGEAVIVWGLRVCGRSLYFPVGCEPEIALKVY